MNKEKPRYDDDSSDSNSSLYDRGPAFRPIAEHRPPEPKRIPEVPRNFLADGILFDRSQLLQRTEEGTHEQNDEDEEFDPDGTAAAKRGRMLASAVVPQARPLRRPPLTELHQTLAQADAELTTNAPGQAQNNEPQVPDEAEQPAQAPPAELTALPGSEAYQHIPNLPPERVELPPDPTMPEPPRAPSFARDATQAYPRAEATPPEPTESEPTWPTQNPNNQPYQPPTPAMQSPNPNVYPGSSGPAAPNTVNYGSNGHNTPPVYQQGGNGNAGGNGGNFNTPPPNNPNQQSTYYSGGGGGAPPLNPNALPAVPVTAFERQPRVIIQKRGSLLPYVAVLAEHIGRKRADRRLKRELGAQIKQQQTTQEQTATQQLRLQKEQQRLADEQRRQFMISQRDKRLNQTVVTPGLGAESAGPRYIGAPGERFAVLGTQAAGEARPAAPMQQPEQYMTNVAEGAQYNTTERASVVVNERGQEVAAAMQYGEDFRNERQYEIIPDHAGDAKTKSGGGSTVSYSGSNGSGHRSAAGYVVGAAYGYGGGSHAPNLPSGMTNPSLPAGSPTHADAQHQLPSTTRTKSGVPGPLFWVMVVVIIAAFFVAALI